MHYINIVVRFLDGDYENVQTIEKNTMEKD